MPITKVRGVAINYELLGDRGPWVALQPGGRRGLVGVKPLGQKIAEAGNRVLVYDRRDCGASDISFDGGNSENEVWADDLHQLLQELDAAPAFIGGSSSGCGWLCWRLCATQAMCAGSCCGGSPAARLPPVGWCRTTTLSSSKPRNAVAWKRSAAPSISLSLSPTIRPNRSRLLSMDVERFMAVMNQWRRSFNEGADHPVIGIRPEELRSMTMPACIIPGNDRTHPREPGQIAHRLMPNAEYHEVVAEDRPDLDVALEDWNAKEGLLAAILRRAQRRY